jgi:hypothetical protein
VNTRRRREPGPQVDELPDAGLGQHPDRPDRERPVGLGQPPLVRRDREDLLRRGPVYRVVVLAAQLVVAHSPSIHTHAVFGIGGSMPTERGNGVPKADQIPWGSPVADESTIGVNARRRRVLHHRGAATRNRPCRVC